MLSGNRHGRILIEGQICSSLKHPSGKGSPLFFVAGFWPGLSWLVIAFLISPYGLPMAAAWLVGIIGGANSVLKDFVFG